MDGSIVARELRRFWLHRLNEVTGAPTAAVADWLTKGAYSFSNPPNGIAFEVSVAADDEPLRKAFSAECARFSSAAFETFLFAEPPATQRKSLGWSVIRSYYGAFFCAHALLRAFGRSVCYVNATQAAAINKIAALQIAGPYPPIPSGIYAIEVSNRARKLVATNLLSKGSHEMLWAEFVGWIDSVTSTLAGTGSTDAMDVSDFFKEMRKGLCSGGANGGSWLSVVRNHVNYGQSYGVWHPYEVSDRTRDSLNAQLSKWKDQALLQQYSPLAKGHELLRFTQLCTSLSSVLLSVLQDIATRCPKGRSFVEQRALPLYKQMQISV